MIGVLAQAAAAVTPVVVTNPENAAIAGQLVSQLTSAATVVYLLQWLKRTKWVPWVNMHSSTLNHWLSIVGALITSVGIHLTFTGTAADGWQGTFMVPSLLAMWHGLTHLVQSYVAQKVLYTAVVKPAGGLAGPVV